MRFYAIFDWICLRGHSLSNIFVWLRTLVPRLQSCSWSSERGPWDYSLVVTWWEDSRQLASITYFTYFAKNALSTLSARFLFLSPQMTQTKRRKRAWKKKVGRACLGESVVMRVFAYALPTFRLRGAYAGELLYFQILAMQTSRLETLQKREGNSSISFCSQQNKCYLQITCVFWTAEISHAASRYTH